MKNLVSEITVEQVDALLPQTQCQECDYLGCLPYAEAIVNNNEALDRCIPGGVSTLQALGKLCNQDVEAFIPIIEEKQKVPALAIIREDECIGCTKCIQACPVDAILGSAKKMHTVIQSECTGCELCVAPCPVDCIDMLAIQSFTEKKLEKIADYIDSDKARRRYQARNQRLENKKRVETKSLASTKKAQALNLRKDVIMQAVARAKAKQQGWIKNE